MPKLTIQLQPDAQVAAVLSRVARELAAGRTFGESPAWRLDTEPTPLPAEEQPAPRFRNYYLCPDCRQEWWDDWSCTCDDDCPHCGFRHVSPYESEDLPLPEPADDALVV